MKRSNLLTTLTSRLAKVRGSLLVTEERIDEIRHGYDDLPNLEATVVDLRTQEEKLINVILMDKPDWQSDSVVPKRPYERRVPIKAGQCTELALAILREAPRPMTSREIAAEVLKRAAVSDPTVKQREHTANAVHAALRAHQSKWGNISSDDSYPIKWWMTQSTYAS